MKIRLPGIRDIQIVLAVGLLITIGGVLGTAGYDLVSELFSPQAGALRKAGGSLLFWLLMIILFGLVLFWAKNVVVDIIDSEARVMPASEEEGQKVLIMALSFIGSQQRLDKMLNAARKYSPEQIALPNTEFETLSGQEGYEDLVGDSWQQNVRSIFAHRKSLEKLIILPSKDSFKQFDAFCEYIDALFGQELEIEYVHGKGRHDAKKRPFALFHGETSCQDYNDYNYVYQGLLRGLQQAGLKRERKAGDIAIDITGGTAVFSIAGAVLTLNDQIKFVYVTTRGHVRHYDARINLLGAAAL